MRRARAWLRRARPAADGAAPAFGAVVRAEAERLATDEPLRLAVVHRGAAPAWARALADRGAVLVAVDADLPGSDRHVRLTAGGPFDLVVDAVAHPEGRVRRFLDGFYQLRAGGAYVVRRGTAGPGGQRLAAVLDRARAARDGHAGDEPGRRAAEDAALGRAVRATWEVHGHLVVVNGAGDALPLLREVELDDLVERRPDLPVRTLRTIPAETFASRASFHEAGSRPASPPPSAYSAPAVPLREYRDAIVAPGQIVVVDRFVAPDTFRHHLQPRLRNRHLTPQADRFARLRDGSAEPAALPGSFFHLDNEERGHYGHLMTEQVSRLWAWEECKAADPDLKVLLGASWRPGIQPYEHTIYRAAGIADDDVVLVDGPVRVERLLSAAPLFSNPAFVHPRITETWRRVGDRLAADAGDGPRPARLFCSRRLAKRSCRNAGEVEDRFREEGFAIVYPEDHPIPDQVAMFRSATVVAGFAGSGLFNLALVDHPVHVVLLRSERYTAHNEHLMAALLGHTIESLVSEPEDPDDFQSPFTVDLRRDSVEGRELDRILATLPA